MPSRGEFQYSHAKRQADEDSFASRLSFELQSETLRTTTYVELQRLGVTLQTVFLKSKVDHAGQLLPSVTGRASLSDPVPRASVPSTPRLSRPGSVDHNGSPFEDLRRRLATINGSSTSLNLNSVTPRDGRASMSPLPTAPLLTPVLPVDMELPPIERPGSPTESVLSANTSAFRGMHRLQGGVIDGPKAAPAVGSSKANAIGLLDTAMRLRSEASPERSGRSSPGSATGTLRGQHRQGQPSVVPISTYGKQVPLSQ
jgi:phosphoinositide-3-kinase, regulatory subunit 4